MYYMFDDILDPSVDIVTGDPSLLWTVLGIVAGVAAITAVVIVLLVKKKKKEGK